mgnify:CR=1 FL=1
MHALSALSLEFKEIELLVIGSPREGGHTERLIKDLDLKTRVNFKTNLTKEDITWLAAHQANKRIIDATANRIDLESDKVMMNIHKYGNTTSATLPLLLHDYESKLKKGVDILVATPGRLLDLHNQKAVKLNRVQILVLDEADHMLDMGFIHDIKKIIALTPPDRQNLLFSATFSPEIKKLAQTLGTDLVEIAAQSPNTTVNAIKQVVYHVDKNQKSNLLSHLIHSEQWPQALVFSRTKHGSEKIAKKLNAADIQTATIHGDKTQGARMRALREFKEKDVRVLVATDVAARGIDISNLPYVVNYDMPTYPNDYIHRIGRTGRAGKEGTAISFMSVDEHKFLRGIEGLLKSKIDQKTEEGFKPTDKPSKEPRSRNFRGKKPSFNKGKPGNKTKSRFKKSASGGGGGKPERAKNKKKGSKAKTRWKKAKKPQ